MRPLLAITLALTGSAAAAQSVQDIYQKWEPAAEYVVSGQDEPGYRSWYLASPSFASQVRTFNSYLQTHGVGGVVPTWQLLRTASQWHRCGAQPFEIPPTSEWPNLVWTLRYVRDHVVPAVGSVEVVSGYRNPVLNQCAGGARESVHQHFSALDLVPLRPTTRNELIQRLCAIHSGVGQRYAVGLGFYSKLRFHVDSWRFRTWGRNDSGGLACPVSYALSHQPSVPPAGAAAAPTAPAGAPPPGSRAPAPPTVHPTVQPTPERGQPSR